MSDVDGRSEAPHRFWLLKTEPECWSWAEQVRVGVEPWDGVRNLQAQKYMREMAVGDLALFYHTGGERSIVGVVEVVRGAYPDSTDPDGRFVRVDVRTRIAFANPVTLAQIKAEPLLEHLLLVRQGRLSVVPIDVPSWQLLLKWGGVESEGC